jgi:DNA-binding protein HU-beta
MNKKNLIRKAALEADLSLGDEKKAVDAFLCAVSDMLRENKEVIIPDFGRFYVKDCPERKFRHPQTGELFLTPATKRVRFKPFGNVTSYALKYGK